MVKPRTSLVKTDCIMYNKENGYCNGLKMLFCADTRMCPFYKSEKKYNSDGSRKEQSNELGR